MFEGSFTVNKVASGIRDNESLPTDKMLVFALFFSAQSKTFSFNCLHFSVRRQILFCFFFGRGTLAVRKLIGLDLDEHSFPSQQQIVE